MEVGGRGSITSGGARTSAERALTVSGQVHVVVDGQEVVTLALGLVLGGELGHRDEDLLGRRLRDLSLLLSFHWFVAF